MKFGDHARIIIRTSLNKTIYHGKQHYFSQPLKSLLSRDFYFHFYSSRFFVEEPRYFETRSYPCFPLHCWRYGSYRLADFYLGKTRSVTDFKNKIHPLLSCLRPSRKYPKKKKKFAAKLHL